MTTLVLSQDQERVFLAGPDADWNPIELALLEDADRTFDGDKTVTIKLTDGSIGFFLRGPYSRPRTSEVALPGDTAWRAIYP